MDRIENVIARIRHAGGIVRSVDLRQQGVAKHDVADAVAAGRLLRLRRRWVALPDADPLLLAAAREGVIVSCITEAARLGLWVAEGGRPHVACHPHAGMVNGTGVVLHRHEPIVPRDPRALSDPTVNVLQAVAICQPHERALAIWDSALNKGLVDKPLLQQFAFSGAAQQLAREASPFRDSGLETFVTTRLRWLRLPIRSQIWLFGRRVDHLIAERLVVQVDGGHHVGVQRADDIAHDAELKLRGYHVIRVGYDQVVNRWPEVQEMIQAAIAQGLHRAA